MPPCRRRLEVSGVVQGVGFRPFVFNLAREHGLSGWVRNHSAGVTIEAEGDASTLADFERDLKARKPPMAVIDAVRGHDIECAGETDFVIQASSAAALQSTPVPSDMATCDECLAELNDPYNRRFGYPFLNCTNCGPRFTIICDLPYDRPATTMAAFKMCAECEAEYHDPTNRRFHAQPNACAVCGPSVTLGELSGPAAIQHAKELLNNGVVLAVKGIGGFHLACDATNEAAVGMLRERKRRFEQPFAVMARDLDVVRQIAHLENEEARLLMSASRPIVLLQKLSDSPLANHVAPGNGYIGVMLPYSPLHHLLLGERPLVMTSANPSGEPIVRENSEAVERLSSIADALLMHNRDIKVVCDDSVVRTFEGLEMPLRRSRGYAPLPVRFAAEMPDVIAVGADLKCTFCVTKGPFAYLSQHIGDMGSLRTLRAFERALDHMMRLFRVTPERAVCDMHPGYQSARWAAEFANQRGIQLIKVQHHHAHVASLLAEHEVPAETPVIGVTFDGTGYGTDAAVWGGEFLIARGQEFERFAHLRNISLAGGDASVKSPARTALSHLRAAGIPWDSDLACVSEFSPTELRVLERQLERGLNCVPCSSMGRLFDAVASLVGVRQHVSYEGQAAIELEALCEPSGRDYPSFAEDGDPKPLLQAIMKDVRAGVHHSQIATGFHDAIAKWVLAICLQARERTGLNLVGLTGGVFQNTVLLRRSKQHLTEAGFNVLVHRKVPANDGGLALGQARLGSSPKIQLV